MGKLGSLLIAAGPMRAGARDASDDEAGDPETDAGDDGQESGDSKTLESADELANLLMRGKGYASDGTCIHMPQDEGMKDPTHPLQHGLRAFKRAHDAAMTAMRSSDRDSERRAEDRGPSAGSRAGGGGSSY